MKSRPFKHLAHCPSFRDHPIVFFTVSTHDRRRCLDCDSALGILDNVWKRSASLNGWLVGNYLLMPDHVHFFARTADQFARTADQPDAIAEWVKAWKSLSSRAIAASLHLAPPLWQEDYFDRYLRSDESYQQKWEYVRHNPVRAGLVSRPDEWPYQGHIFDLRFE